MFFQNVTPSISNYATLLLYPILIEIDWPMTSPFFITLSDLCGLRVSAVHLHLPFQFRRLSPSHPPKRNVQNARGGYTRTIRCTCVISAASAGPPASQNCQFSGIEGAIRQSFQRKYCKICKICESCESFAILLSRH